MTPSAITGNGVIEGVTTIGKFVGGFIGNALAGGNVHESAAIGVGMIPKTGVELAILSVGLAEGFITRQLYSAIVVLVLVSVLVTPSLLKAIISRPNRPD